MIITAPYTLDATIPSEVTFTDHLEGFSKNNTSRVLSEANDYNKNILVTYHQILSNDILSKVPMLDIRFSSVLQDELNLCHFHPYRVHPKVSFKNLLCSFNGSGHVSRQLLTSALRKFGLFNDNYSTKNFKYTKEHIDGHLSNLDLSKVQQQLYMKFLTDDTTFLNNVYSHGHVQYNHPTNIYNLEGELTGSFIHVVSETMATSYYPFITEKFLYSVVTRGLFLTYGQPKWHEHITSYYGFKRYDKIFDYSFDDILNPVERLVKLLETVRKFDALSTADWHDLYLMEYDTIEYNYDHYFSKRYMEHLKKYEN
jgi:hypothetical protein